ncbi:integrase [Salirhabdus euzebyi]|uniref:Integrase n=1 Tax=Salirhabdus euzebyi TaxID=394506 RepID=A0A841Q1L8_9BACI|nr:tyrosine-type recombinase/integrase [Salirhabdus euzebyi]MBB6452022.1 integrase [Salirhabdus euzebyi]
MASFQKRGKTWQYTISAKPKPIRKSGFSTKKEAQIAASEVEAELRKGVAPNLKPVPFDEYFESWLKVYKPNIAKNTMERYLNTLETIRIHFGGTALQNINKRKYQSFLNDYGKDHAKATSRKLNSHIRSCVREAIDEGIIRVDFTRGVTLTGKDGKRAEEKHLNYAESKLLLNELYKRLDKSLTHYLLLLGLTSGMRFAEMVGLTRKDFDFQERTINITKTWGYTKKMHEGFGPTKNERSIRKIRMDSIVMNAFKKLFESTPDNILRLVFFSPESKYKVISNGNANKVLERILKELKIEPITVHGLRHTHASVSLYEQVSIYYVAERLGHADTETTNKHYAHIIKELRERDEEKTVSIFQNMIV